MDYKRKLFLNLIQRIEQWEVGHLLLAHQDRLSRFGFDWFEHTDRQHGCALIVVNHLGLWRQAEMVEDLTAVVDTFACRLPGLRSTAGGSRMRPMAKSKPAKVTRILHSQGLHRTKFERLEHIAERACRVRADAWQRCSGLSTAPQTTRNIRERMYDHKIALYTPHRKVQRLLQERTGTTEGTAPPGLEPSVPRTRG